MPSSSVIAVRSEILRSEPFKKIVFFFTFFFPAKLLNSCKYIYEVYHRAYF
jgi:hypothetical protein